MFDGRKTSVFRFSIEWTTFFAAAETFFKKLLTTRCCCDIITTLHKVRQSREWRNWQTRTFEGRVVFTVRVQVPFPAPIK